jgi:hypothetical protein
VFVDRIDKLEDDSKTSHYVCGCDRPCYSTSHTVISSHSNSRLSPTSLIGRVAHATAHAAPIGLRIQFKEFSTTH